VFAYSFVSIKKMIADSSIASGNQGTKKLTKGKQDKKAKKEMARPGLEPGTSDFLAYSADRRLGTSL
jgi:hypothetical protein